MRLKPPSPTLAPKLQLVNATVQSLSSHPAERWKTLKSIAKQQAAQLPKQAQPASDGPLWTQREESLFGPPDDQLRLIKCDNCGILTRETNGKVGVTHKLNCEMLRKSGAGPGMSKKPGLFSAVETIASKKRASSEVSLDSSHLPVKKKKTTIIDHTIPESGVPLPAITKKQMKKVLAAAERLERENQRKEKKRLEEEARKATKKMGRVKGGPVNVNEQCGVLIPPNDVPCARSLTCKTHSMGAKRSVPGRSAPYDVLLNEWQKKNNPNWGDRKVVTPRVGPGIEPGVSKKKKKEQAAAAGPRPAQPSGAPSATSKPGQPKERSAASKSNPVKTQQGGPHVASASKKKDHAHHKAEGRPQTEKLSAVNEARLLGEIDADFYLLIPPKPKPKPTAPAIDLDGDTVMGEKSGAEEEEEEDETGPSDIELELVCKGLAATQESPLFQPLVRQTMGSAWVVPRWTKFGKLGVKDCFREEFKGKH